MTPVSSRRMRRTRGVPTSSDEELLSYFDLYEIQGDSRSALDVFATNRKEEGAKPTLASDYNLLLLQQLAANQSDAALSRKDFLRKLDAFEAEVAAKKADQLLSARQHQRNEFIMAYNRALVLQASGDIVKSIAICNEKLNDMITRRQKPADEIVPAASRMALLLLECLLALAVGRNSGFSHERFGSPTADATIEWLELLDTEQDPQLKFLLALYKSRVGLAQLDQDGKHVDSKIRSARKELKSAMELFQNKLRPSFGAETGSVVSSANSEEMSQHHHASILHLHHHEQPQPPSSLVLQKYNQSALSLKANLEQLKGNTKKSLILCSEAQVATKDDGAYDAVHSNNLAVVYESNGKRHLALHALTKALRANHNNKTGDDATLSSVFHKDGTTRPDLTLEILHNAAICALQTRNYLSAYECMVTCVTRSEVFGSRPRCWLRVAEACLGIFTELKKRQQKSGNLASVEIDG
jgi:tetratricopeptide (TPR) repeat protein